MSDVRYLEGEECMDIGRNREVNSRLKDVFPPNLVWVDKCSWKFSLLFFVWFA